MVEDPSRTLDRVRTRLANKADKHADALKDSVQDTVDVQVVKELATRAIVIGGFGLLIGVDPVAAQAGSVDQIVSMMKRLSDLLFRLGMATAVVGLSAAGIAYMVHKPRLAKEIAKNVIVGTLILLFSSAAIDWLSGGF